MAALLGCPSGRSTMRLILFLRSPPWRPGGYLREARAARVASPVAPRRSPVAPVAKRESRWSCFSGEAAGTNAVTGRGGAEGCRRVRFREYFGMPDCSLNG